MNKAHKELLRNNFESACNDYVKALLGMWGLNVHYGYWVGDEIGGIYDYDGGFAISMEDIIYCVENGVTEQEYEEMLGYCVKCAEYNLPTIKLSAWHKGAPKYDFTKLDALKRDLSEAIENEKNKF